MHPKGYKAGKQPKQRKTMPKAWYEYQEKRRLGLVKPKSAAEGYRERKKIMEQAFCGERYWLSDEQCEAILNTKGYYSDVSTLPLKDANFDPVDKFLDNFDWSELDFTEIPVGDIIEKYGEEEIKGIRADLHKPLFCYSLKHPHPRKGFLNKAFRLDQHNYHPWYGDHFVPSYSLPSLYSACTNMDLYDMGLYLYRLLHIPVSTCEIHNLTYDGTYPEHKKIEDHRHPTHVGFNYLFEMVHKDNPSLRIERVENPVSKRAADKKLQITDVAERRLYFSRYEALKDYKAAIKKKLLTEKEAKNFIMRRYRLVLGRPVKVERPENLSSNRAVLTTLYNKGGITERENFMIHDMLRTGVLKEK